MKIPAFFELALFLYASWVFFALGTGRKQAKKDKTENERFIKKYKVFCLIMSAAFVVISIRLIISQGT